MSDLADFLLARIAEDEAVARQVARGDAWHIDGDWRDDRTELVGGGKILAAFTDEDRMAPHHVATWSPARVLAECEAKRRIVGDLSTELHEAEEHGDRHDAACATHYLRLIALPYADHPDYRDEWRP